MRWLSLAVGTLLSCAHGGPGRPAPGALAPDFALPATPAAGTGETIRLSDLRGKIVVLAFFPKAFTYG